METIKQKTKLEIIEETEKFYSNPANRGTDGNGYVYKTEDGRKCAVGRCLIDKDLAYLRGSITDVVSHGVYLNSTQIDALFLSEYKGHEITFWRALQKWHDDSRNFTNIGISDKGLIAIELLKQKYNDKS